MTEPVNKRLLVKAIGTVLKGDGFVKKNSSFYKHSPETILIVNLQKSIYSEAYYINIAVWMKQEGEQVEWPLYYKAHLRSRAECLFANSEIFDKALNFMNDIMEHDARIEYIAGVIRDEVLPFLLRHQTFDGIRDVICDEGTNNKWMMICGGVREFLGIA